MKRETRIVVAAYAVATAVVLVGSVLSGQAARYIVGATQLIGTRTYYRVDDTTNANDGGRALFVLGSQETQRIVNLLNAQPAPAPPSPSPQPAPPPPAPAPAPGPSPAPSPSPAPGPTSCSRPVPAACYFISPTGLDSNDGKTSATPVKTFTKAFGLMGNGGELWLLDGTFGTGQGTGYMNDLSGTTIPAGSAASMTLIHAVNPGKVFQNGTLFVGRSSGKKSYVDIEGITFQGGTAGPGVTFYNTSFNILRQVGAFSVVNDGGAATFDIGTNDVGCGGPCTNTDNLFEDVWGAGKARGIAANYRADRNTWRRVVIRGDGCTAADCAGSGNPNIGLTVYDSQGATLENVVVMDRVLTCSPGGCNYGDFAVAQHTPGLAGGNNQWLGTISVNAPDVGYYFEPDQQTINPSNTLKNVVAWNSVEDGISIARSGQAIVENATLKPKGGTALYFGSGLAAGSYAKTVLALAGSVSGVTVQGGLSTSDAAASLPLQSAKGATIQFRYQDRVLTTIPLLPWPNEDRIKAEMCAGGVTRGFCSDPMGLTHYLMNLK